jgi:hypothetical protein
VGSDPASSSRSTSGVSTPNTPTQKKGGPLSKKSGSSTPIRSVDPRHLDLAAFNLTPRDEDGDSVAAEPPKMSFAREKLLEEARRVIEAGDGNRKKGVSLVVIGMWIGTSAVVSLPGISLFRSR